MTEEIQNIWIWIQKDTLFKAIINKTKHRVTFYKTQEGTNIDKIILKREGLSNYEINVIETTIIKYGAKHLNKDAEPFRFL